MKTLGFAAALLFVVACGGSGSPAPKAPTPASETSATESPSQPENGAAGGSADPLAQVGQEEIARGAKVYEDQCSFCHGDDAMGQGKTPGLRGDGAMSRFASNQELFDYTKAEMPKNDKGTLSDADTAAVLAWLKSGS
jgi:mono/diheme cytochrome c family protein